MRKNVTDHHLRFEDGTSVEDGAVRDGVHYHRHDVVIVGAGGAGMRAAIEAAPTSE